MSDIDLTSCDCGGTCYVTSFDVETGSDVYHENDSSKVESGICPEKDLDAGLDLGYCYDFDWHVVWMSQLYK